VGPWVAPQRRYREALDGLADHLAKLGCTVVGTSPGMPDLARTTRNYNEVLLALIGTDLSPDERVRIEATANALTPDDQSLTATQRGFVRPHR
jgi:hypothetical protein